MAPAGTKVLVTSCVVANPDGKVRESKDRKVLTRNITERVQETEERIHNGDTTHDVSTRLLSFILLKEYFVYSETFNTLDFVHACVLKTLRRLLLEVFRDSWYF